MAKTCGYVCPVCEGLGFDKETLEDCDFCKPKAINTKATDISAEDWMKNVHEGNCCSDIGIEEKRES